MANRNVEALVAPLYLGNGVNRTVVGVDGTVTQEGSAVTWNDMRASLTGAKLGEIKGTADFDYDEAAVRFNPSGLITLVDDRIMMNFQVPHDALVGSPFNFHIHWWQDSVNIKQFTVEYRVQTNGAVKATAWTQVIVNATGTANAFTYTSGTINQITKLFSLSTAGFGLSAQIQVRMTRSDATVGDALATYLDAHYQVDSSGSSQEYVK